MNNKTATRPTTHTPHQHAQRQLQTSSLHNRQTGTFLFCLSASRALRRFVNKEYNASTTTITEAANNAMTTLLLLVEKHDHYIATNKQTRQAQPRRRPTSCNYVCTAPVLLASAQPPSQTPSAPVCSQSVATNDTKTKTRAKNKNGGTLDAPGTAGLRCACCRTAPPRVGTWYNNEKRRENTIKENETALRLTECPGFGSTPNASARLKKSLHCNVNVTCG